MQKKKQDQNKVRMCGNVNLISKQGQLLTNRKNGRKNYVKTFKMIAFYANVCIKCIKIRFWC